MATKKITPKGPGKAKAKAKAGNPAVQTGKEPPARKASRKTSAIRFK